MKYFTNVAAACALLIGTGEAAMARTTYIPIVVPTYSGPVAPPHNSGDRSLFLQCDGKPAIMSDAEKFARFMGAITLLGLFAPRPEVPEPGARLFGDKGVAACSPLIDPGPQQAKNPLRRMQLILARSAHHIEAKAYTDAIADVTLARSVAQAQGLIGNPYFERSAGLSFNLLEAMARIGLGDLDAARSLGLAATEHSRWSVVPLLATQDMQWASPTGSAQEDAYHATADKLFNYDAYAHAVRLEILGRYAEAASLREAIIARDVLINREGHPTWTLATAALSHAMAGEWDQATARAAEAHTAQDVSDATGKTDNVRANTLEQLDFYNLLLMAHQGKVDEARTLFSARSEWSAVSIGIRFGATDLLRKGARPEQLSGTLAKSGAQRFDELRLRGLTYWLQTSFTNNSTLFSYVLPFASVEDYEKLSGSVWNLDHERFIRPVPMPGSRFSLLSGGLTAPEPQIMLIAQDAMLLHSALAAKKAGFKGLLYLTSRSVNESSAVMFANPGPDIPAQFYIDADEVIADLSPLIPSPQELDARVKAREQAVKKS